MATNKDSLIDREGPEFYFDAPELKLHPLLRRLAEALVNIWLITVAVSAVVFIFSEVGQLKALGGLLALYFVDRIIHLRGSAYPLGELPPSGRVNLFYYLSRDALGDILRAEEAALLFGGNFFLHLTSALIKSPEISEALRRLDVGVNELSKKLDDFLKPSLGNKNNKPEIRKAIEALVIAALETAERGRENISRADILVALSRSGDADLVQLLELFSIKPEDLERALVFGRFRARLRWFKQIPSSLGGFASRSSEVRHRFMNRAWTARPTPNLDKFSIDFSDMAREGKIGFMIGHEREYDVLLDVLARPNKPNALIVGEVGSGKDTLVGHLAYMINLDKVPAPLFDKRVVMLDFGALLAGAEEGELQERIQTIFNEILSARNIILYIPDIHNLIRTEAGKGLAVAHTIIPIITSNDFPVIGNSYPEEYKKVIQPDNSFSEAFELIRLQEVSVSEAELILSYDSLLLEEIYKVEISYSAIKAAVDLAHKYFRDKALPSSADDLLKEALVDASHKGKKNLTSDDIIFVAERRTNIPIKRAGKEEAEKLLNLEPLIHEKLIDQDSAVEAVARSLREYRSGLGRKGGPIGTFLFVGPTGVGKTELSKILARIQFGSEEMMIRFDMSEYQDKTSLQRFIGSPDGEISGALTSAILEKPYSLVLLDEFEKAHPDILNLFLQVFDDGRLTDNFGRVVDFSNTVIIATSNAHSEFIKTSLDEGKTMEEIAEELKKKLIDYFKPELLNRFSSIVVFKALSPEDVLAITKLQLRQFAEDLKTSQDAEITFTDEVVRAIARWGYDPAYGARPLREVISKQIRSPLSEKILKGELRRGAKIQASLGEEKLEFTIS